MRPGRGPLLFAAALFAAALLVWLGLGMHRGLLLSAGIQAKVWPWAPDFPAPGPTVEALSDPVWQFVPWIDLARREIAAGRLPLWNPHQDGGVPLLGNAQSALGSPLLWPALLLGVAGGWNLSVLARILLGGLGTYVWLRDAGRSRLASLLGSTVFALSGAFVAWLEHPQTLAAAPVPLLLLFAARVARWGRRRDFAGLAVATYLVLAGGHPETWLMAAMLAAAVTLRAAEPKRAAFAPVGAALLGAGLAAPFLLTFAEYYGLSAARVGGDRQPFVLSLRDLGRFLEPGMAGSNAIEAAATVSILGLALAVAGAAVGFRRDRDVRLWCAVALAILLITYANPVSLFFAAHTPVFWTRALLFFPLPVAFLASGALDSLRRRLEERGERRLAGALASAVVLAVAAELFAAAQGVHGRTRPQDLAITTPLLRRLVSDRDPFRILPLHTFLPPNTATTYGLDDVRGYDALAPRAWRERRGTIGRFTAAPTQSDVLEPWNLAPGGAGLDAWSVQYLLLHPQFAFGAAELNARLGLDLEEVYAGPDGRILRNSRAAPRARLSGGGRVRIAERLPTLWRLEVDTTEEAELTVANPMFPGWTARVDGKAVPLRSAPGDPIRVAVAPGRHEVALLYRPRSFALGVAIAVASGLVLLVWLRAAQPDRGGGLAGRLRGGV